MKSSTQYFWFNTKNRQEFINITPQVEEAVKRNSVVYPGVIESSLPCHARESGHP